MRAVHALCAAGLLAAGLAPAAAAQDLPQGFGREPVVTRCLTCHEADLITQQRLTRTGWGRTLDKMVRWGAVIQPDEREPMLDYLAAHFTARPVSGNIMATASSEAVYKRECLTCHEEDLIKAQRLTRSGWTRTVDKMIRWGATVPADAKDALVDYLAARYAPQ